MRSPHVRKPIVKNRCAICPHSRLSHTDFGCRFCRCEKWTPLEADAMNLDEFNRQLKTQLKALLHRTDVRIIALVPIGDDEILRERLAQSCAGIAHPVIAVFDVTEGAGS